MPMQVCRSGEPRLSIVTGPLPAGCPGGEYRVDGIVRGSYPVSCTAVPAGTHAIEVVSERDCAGMGRCELLFEPGRDTVYDLRQGCPTNESEAPDPASSTEDCDVRYRRGFRVDLGRGVEELRIIPNPHWASNSSLDSYRNPCDALGGGWRIAIGSFGDSFLSKLQATRHPELRATLGRCPITYRNVDTVCAPCAYGSTNCPCARRDVSDWLFCTRDEPAP
jgi:hypothetical protein